MRQTDEQPLTPDQIEEGVARIRHQLTLLRSGPSLGGWSDDASLIATLEAELQALEEARARAG